MQSLIFPGLIALFLLSSAGLGADIMLERRKRRAGAIAGHGDSGARVRREVVMPPHVEPRVPGSPSAPTPNWNSGARQTSISGMYRAQYGASEVFLPDGHPFAAGRPSNGFVRLDLEEEALPDYYGLLDVPLTSTDHELEQAYRRHVAAIHPDRFFGDPARYATSVERLKELNEAMTVLRDPFTRSLYDIKYRSHLAPTSARSRILRRTPASGPVMTRAAWKTV